MIGDILFFTGSKTLWSRIIRLGLGTDITHVAIQNTSETILEVTPSGIREQTDIGLPKYIRVRPNSLRLRKYKAVAAVESLQHFKYGWGQALAIWLRRVFKINVSLKSGIICSELAAMYANELGMDLDTDYYAPDGLLKRLLSSNRVKWEVVGSEYPLQ